MAWSEEAIAYLRKHREYVQRDLGLLRSGRIGISERQGGQPADVTAAWIARYERQIGHLDRIIAAYARADRGAPAADSG